MPLTQRFVITDVRSGSSRSILLHHDDRDAPGWNRHVKGWSLGAIGSGSRIEIDEPLKGTSIAIVRASNHVILWGRAPSLELDIFFPDLPSERFWQTAGALVDAEDLAQWSWMRVDPDRPRPGGTHRADVVRLRFDRVPLRLGSHILQMPSQ